MTIRNDSERPPESREALIVRAVKPCVDLRVDLSRLPDRETLLHESRLSPELRAGRMFLRSGEKDLPDGKMIWLRVLPAADQCTFELVDLLAVDLEKCQRVFALVHGFQDHVGFLSKLAAPSFPGKRAIDVLWNLMALGGMETMFFGDGSTLLASSSHAPACCDSGALTSLRSIGAFADGKSWYEMQGATGEQPAIPFQSFALAVEPLADDLLEDSKDRRILTRRPEEFDRMVFERRSFLLREFQPSLKAYRLACHFLHSLPLRTLDDGLARLSDRYPSLLRLRETLSEASSVTSCSGSVGGLVKSMMKRRDVPAYHQLHHEIRDRLVTNKESVFFPYIADVLDTQYSHDEVSCMLAWCALRQFGIDLRNGGFSQKETCDVVAELLDAAAAQRNAIAQRVCKDVHCRLTSGADKRLGESEEIEAEPIAKQVRKADLKHLEQSNGSPSVKMCAHSNRLQRKRWHQYATDVGDVDAFFSAQQAIQYLVRLPLKTVQSIYPELGKRLESRFHPTDEMTVSDLMKSVDSNARGWILDELLRGANNHISALFVRYLEGHQAAKIESEKMYALFNIAKTVCDGMYSFTFRIL